MIKRPKDGNTQPWFYNCNTGALSFWWKMHHLTSETVILAPGTQSNPKDRYEIMAFAAEARSKALGAALSGPPASDGNVRFTKFDDATDLQALWIAAGANGNGPKERDGRPFSAHKWHSAQFRSTNMFQHKYWERVLGFNGFRIIDPEDHPNTAP